jgi:hypothetical protein
MRIRIVRTPTLQYLDGIDLRRFEPGQIYEVGNTLGAVMLAEEWAAPVADDRPALLIPFGDDDPYIPRVMDRRQPPNLVREIHPPYLDESPALAADFERRRRPRHKH